MRTRIRQSHSSRSLRRQKWRSLSYLAGIVGYVSIFVFLFVYIRRHQSWMASIRVGSGGGPGSSSGYGSLRAQQLLQSIYDRRQEVANEKQGLPFSTSNDEAVLTNLLLVSNQLLPPAMDFRESIAKDLVPNSVTHAEVFDRFNFTEHGLCPSYSKNFPPVSQANRMCPEGVLYCPVVASLEYIPGAAAPAVTCCLADLNRDEEETGIPKYKSTPTADGPSEFMVTMNLGSNGDRSSLNARAASRAFNYVPLGSRRFTATKASQAVDGLDSQDGGGADFVFVIDLSPSMGDYLSPSFYEASRDDGLTKIQQAKEMLLNLFSHFSQTLRQRNRIGIIGLHTIRDLSGHRSTDSGDENPSLSSESKTRAFVHHEIASVESNRWEDWEGVIDRLLAQPDGPEDDPLTYTEQRYFEENPTARRADRTFRFFHTSHRALEVGIDLAGKMLSQKVATQHVVVISDAFSSTTTTSRFVVSGNVTRTIRGRGIINYDGIRRSLSKLERHVGVSIAMLGSGDDEHSSPILLQHHMLSYKGGGSRRPLVGVSDKTATIFGAVLSKVPSNQHRLFQRLVRDLSGVRAYSVNYISQAVSFCEDLVRFLPYPNIRNARLYVEPLEGWGVRKIYGNPDGFNKSHSQLAAADRSIWRALGTGSRLVQYIGNVYQQDWAKEGFGSRAILIRLHQVGHSPERDGLTSIAKVALIYEDSLTGKEIMQDITLRNHVSRSFGDSVADPSDRPLSGPGAIGSFLIPALQMDHIRVLDSSSEIVFHGDSFDVLDHAERFAHVLNVLGQLSVLALYVDLIQEWLNSFQRRPLMELQGPQGFAERFTSLHRWMQRVPFETTGEFSLIQPMACDSQGFADEMLLLQRLSSMKTAAARYGGLLMIHSPH